MLYDVEWEIVSNIDSHVVDQDVTTIVANSKEDAKEKQTRLLIESWGDDLHRIDGIVCIVSVTESEDQGLNE